MVTEAVTYFQLEEKIKTNIKERKRRMQKKNEEVATSINEKSVRKRKKKRMKKNNKGSE